MSEHHHHVESSVITRATVLIVVALFLLSVIVIADITLSTAASHQRRNPVLVRCLYVVYLIVFGLVLHDVSDGMQPSCLDASASQCTISFHYHVLLASIAWVVFATEGFLGWQGESGWQHSALKLYHASMHLCSFLFTLSAVVVASSVHSFKGHPHINTSHSWMGTLTLMLQAWQLVLGVYSFYFSSDERFKKSFLATHRILGILIYIMAAATISMGLLEYSSSEALEEVYSAARIRVHIAVTVLWLMVFQVILGTSAYRPEVGEHANNHRGDYTQAIELETLMDDHHDDDDDGDDDAIA
eukprot:TRINITY_DN11590_c0_g1_i1.p1 TRINITY_DN11590_c0_g1~~TRINITY_DN11590_c0_g1_i1.p1  ORF type:complete len:300 (+),score=45.59 TRINITY_DN11590_c0_g1_i1:74-973(+)